MSGISNEQMKQVRGGSINWGLMAGISAVASFVIGIFDGWTNPKKCNR